jgi:catalase
VELDALLRAIEAAKGKVVLIAPKIGGAKLKDGTVRPADAQLAGAPSVLFDAVALALSKASGESLAKEAAAVQFAMDAFGHLKAIGASDGAQPLLEKAGVEPDEGVTGIDEAFVEAATRRYYAREPNVRTLA